MSVDPIRCGAIVLAAGPASRMGNPKQLLKLGGQSLIRRTVSAALDGGCDTVVVVTGAHGEAVAADLAGLTAIIAFNPDWPRGMGTSLRAGLAALLAATPQTELALVLLCDQPHLDPQVIRNLIATWSTSGKPMAASEYADTVGPPCCFAKSQFASLAAIADHDGAKKLLLANPQSVTKIPWPAGTVDVDTPEDWRKITRE